MLVLLAFLPLLEAGEAGSRVRYMGGTVVGVQKKTLVRVDTEGNDALRLRVGEKILEVPYKDVSTLEYGLRVSRRYAEAVLISPVFLLAKKKAHFLTIGYTDEGGARQAMVLEVSGADIRPLLVGLEARTGRKIEFQDDEAPKAGK